MPFVKRLGCNLGVDIYNGIGFCGHGGVEKLQEFQQSLRGWTSWEKTNSAVAKLLSAVGRLGSLSEASSAGCSSGGPVISVEADGEEGFGSTLPKQPSSNLVREEVSVPVRATLILLKLSYFNCAALPSRCTASSRSITPT